MAAVWGLDLSELSVNPFALRRARTLSESVSLVYKSFMDTCRCKAALASVLVEYCPDSGTCKGTKQAIISLNCLVYTWFCFY